MMNFQRFGDSAMLINFEQKIDVEINNLVIQLAEKIRDASISGIRFCTPAYCSITIGFDPKTIIYEDLCEKIKKIETLIFTKKNNQTQRILNIPVCYKSPYSIDLQELIEIVSLSKSEIIRLHTTTIFRVFMLGFLPGFPYMGILPDSLICQRKKIPRLRVPAQSVGLAGKQTGIYPSEAPGGWQIIGRTPIKVFDPIQENPFLFQAGDLVKFHAISEISFQKIEKDILLGNFQTKQLYE